MTIAPGADIADLPEGTGDSTPVYLDCNATTPIDPVVLAEVVHYLQDDFGNAGSRTHSYGQRAKERVNRAREQVAAPAGAKPDEVIFTSGATESNNLAILGLEQAGRDSGRMHIVTTQIEHKAVLEPIHQLVKRGFEVTEIAPNAGGWVEPDRIVKALRDDTLMVSVMAANNETGVIQPIEEIANNLNNSSAYMHVDAAQAYGKVGGLFANPRIDLISLSGHKLFAPKGIGALIARRRGYRRIPLNALLVGGGQERGLRSGTLPVPLIAGLGCAVELATAKCVEREEYANKLRSAALAAFAPLDILLNGDQRRTLPHTLNFSVPGVDSEAAIVALKNVAAVSNGSACTSQSYEPSHVLVAMGFDDDRINGALRLSWSHLTPNPDWLALASNIERIRNH